MSESGNATLTLSNVKKRTVTTAVSMASVRSTDEIDTWAIQPSVNYDTSPLGGYAWFVAKGPSQGTPFPYQAGRLMLRKLAWETNGAEWKSSWTMLSSPASYLTYFDLDRGAVTAPQKGTTYRIDLRRTGSRLMMALIKGGVLWTCLLPPRWCRCVPGICPGAQRSKRLSQEVSGREYRKPLWVVEKWD